MKNILLLLMGLFVCVNGVFAQNSNLQTNQLSYETAKYNTMVQPEIFRLNSDNDIVSNSRQAPFLDNWVSPDVQVDTGQLVSIGFRQISLKQGPDLAMYVIVNRKNITGQFNGKMVIYRSDNGGLNWVIVSTFQSPTLYFGQFSAIVENSSSSVEDSTRIIIFYTNSPSSNLLNASLNIYSVRKNGTGVIQGTVSSPSSGNKYFNPSAFSNGAYEAENTIMGVVVGEYDNTTELSTSIRYLRTTDWGQTFQSVSLIDPGYSSSFSDYFPSAGYKMGSSDSVYIAVERRATAGNDTLVRVIATPWVPTSSASTHFLTSSPTNHEKPVISILQTGPGDNNSRQIMITCIKDAGTPVYFASGNSGSSWSEIALGTSTQRDIKYAVCSSDPDTTGGGYFLAVYQDALFGNSDSITVRRGTLTDMGPYFFKQNDIQASGFMSPSAALYKYTPMGGSPQKKAAFLYAGVGPTNAYYDQENLPVGIVSNNGIATDFKLSQNYPNPFNPTTKIDFAVPSLSNVKLVVYDMLGKEVSTLVNKSLNAGSYTFEFNGAELASGMYFYRINVEGNNGSFSEVKKMMLIK